MKAALITEEQIKDILYALESCQETGWTTAYDENAVDEALAIVRSLKVSEPVAWIGHSGNLTYSVNSLMPSVQHLAKPLYAGEQP